MKRRRGFSKTVKDWVFYRFGGRCYFCAVPLNRGPDDFNRDPRRFTIDHIHPVARGGGNQRTNLVACCRRCNSSKGARKEPVTPHDWMPEEYENHMVALRDELREARAGRA